MSVDEVRAVLDDLLNGPEPDWGSEIPPPAPEDERAASRMVHRYLDTQAEIVRINDMFGEEIAALENRRDALLEGVDGQHGPVARLAKLKSALRLWHQARLAEDDDAITIHLPAGTLASSKAQDEWVYDEPMFIAWARKNAPSLIVEPVPEPRIVKGDARKMLNVTGRNGKAVTDTGEIIPGLTIKPGGEDMSGRHFRIKGGPK